MRSSPFLASLALVGALVSCGGSSEPPPSVPVVVPSASAASTVPPPPVAETASEPMLPHAAALVASLDLGALDEELKASSPAVVGLLTELPIVSREQLTNGVRGIGLDPSRPARIAVSRPHDDEVKAVASLPQQPRPQETRDVVANPGAAEAMRKAVAGVAALLSVRLIVPVSDAATFRKIVAASLERYRFEAQPGGVWIHSGKQLIALSGNDRSVAIDIISGNDVKAGLAALRADAAASVATDMLPLEGRSLRVVYSPRALAVHGILAGATMTVGAVSGASLEPMQVDRIASEGLWELMQWRPITESSAGAYIERVEASFTRRDGKMELTERLETGPGWTFGPDEAWKPSASVTIEGAESQLEVSNAFLDAVPLPEVDPRSPRTTFEQFLMRAREAGMATPIIHGHLLLAGARDLFERRRPGDSFPRQSFERVGIFARTTIPARPSFFGVLPAKTTRAAAECALAPRSPCDAKRRLKLNATVAIGQDQGRLVQVGDRFVVLLGEKETIQGKVTPSTAGPIALQASLARMFPMRELSGMLRTVDRVNAVVERDGKTITLRAQTM